MRTKQMISPVDPLPIPGGSLLVLYDGRVIWRFDPLASDASAEDAAYFTRYISALRGAGHQVIVGDMGMLLRAAAEGRHRE